MGRIVAQGFEILSPPGKARYRSALYAAQEGKMDPAVKPLKGFSGGSVLEIAAPYEGNTWRAVYTV